jgi:hypothetical protein
VSYLNIADEERSLLAEVTLFGLVVSTVMITGVGIADGVAAGDRLGFSDTVTVGKNDGDSVGTFVDDVGSAVIGANDGMSDGV